MNNVYTHGHHESVLRSHTWRTAENSAGYLLPHLRPGMSLLDVGAGPGTITADLARAGRAGPGHRPRSDRGGAGHHQRDLRQARRRRSSSWSATSTRSTSRTTRTTSCTRTRSCSTWRIRCRRCGRCAGSASRAGSSPSATPTTTASSGTRSCPSWTSGWRSTSGWRAPTAASRTPAGDCCPGRWRPASRRSTRPRATGRSPTRTRALVGRDVGGPHPAVGHGDQARARRRTGGDARRISAAWRTWAARPDGWISILHGELLCTA